MFNFLKKKIDDIEADEIFVEKGYSIKEDKLDDLLWEIELALLEADVATEVVEVIKDKVKHDLLDTKILKGVEPSTAVQQAIRKALVDVLSSSTLDFDKFISTHEKPVILMFVGVNGTGKTTAIAKVVHYLQQKKKSTVIAAGDTFRAGAIEQMQQHADKLGVKLIKHKSGADPAAVSYDALEHAKARHREVLLIDTAGRMQTNQNLMDEMKKIKKVAKPHLIIFVGDSLAGNDAVEQAKKFNEAVGIDCAILTKIDADAKGGAALSIAFAVGVPIIFVSTGQEYEKFQPFNADWMVDQIFSS